MNPRKTTRGRIFLFRALALALGLSVVCGAELLCRVFGLGGLPVSEDPFVGFKRVDPLFVLNGKTQWWEVAPAKLKFFSPESFPAKKKGFRVFCLGGSTVKGRPYAKETSFTTWLKLSLEAAQPDREWEVVNCGGISYASYRLVNLMKECLSHEPDLFVVCTGHNEFLEDRTYEWLKRVPDAVAVSRDWASHLRLYRIGRRLFETRAEGTGGGGRHVMPEEVEALLDYRGGLEVYDRNDKWRADVVRHFDSNLRIMARLANESGVPLVFVRPPSDLRSTPPFKSLHRDDLSLDDRLEWQEAVNRGRDAYASDMVASVNAFREALLIDDRFAELHFELGKCLERLGRVSEAKRAYTRALEEDICPLRMIEALDRAMRDVAGAARFPLVDAHALLERESAFQILGNDQLVDHIHPSIEGHKRIADALLGVLEREGICRRAPGWEARRKELYDSHFATLDAAYFAAARRALHGLEEWAAGRSDGPPIEALPSPRKR
ncbi:MAG: tetratricopeptide repeat protein [Verrucomicrobiae bacterium]|nr:tetratricopeptide repeat protein [Verrucomicrobiae bacterium]